MSTHNLCFEQEYKKYQIFFLSENFPFLVVKVSIYLNRRVFVMTRPHGEDFCNVLLAFLRIITGQKSGLLLN